MTNKKLDFEEKRVWIQYWFSIKKKEFYKERNKDDIFNNQNVQKSSYAESLAKERSSNYICSNRRNGLIFKNELTGIKKDRDDRWVNIEKKKSFKKLILQVSNRLCHALVN
jgi:hypothetical protein